jgi:hypothetical protein
LTRCKKKTDASLAQLSQQVSDTRSELAGVGKSQGLVAEEFFYNSLLEEPVVGDVHYDQVQLNLNAGRKSDYFECDLALINGKSVALVEVKYNLKISAIEQIESNIRRFKQFFPYFAKHKIYGGVAGLHVPKAVEKLAHEKGLFVLKRRGELLKVDATDMKAF